MHGGQQKEGENFVKNGYISKIEKEIEENWREVLVNRRLEKTLYA